jgi:hypothetical protein
MLLPRLTRLLPVLTSLALLALFVSVLWRYPTTIGTDDSLRHFAMGQRLWLEGFWAGYGWQSFLTFGFLADHIVDPWFLADVAFAVLSPLGLVDAVRAFTLLSIAVLLGSALLVFHWLRVPPLRQALLLLLFVLWQPDFYYRLLLGRPFVLQTAFALLVLGAVLARRPWWVALGLLVAVPTSQLFVFPLALALVGSVWLWCEGEREMARRCLLATLGGGLLGLVLLQPAPVAYVSYLVAVFVRIPFLSSVELSGEMQGGLTSLPWALPVFVVTLGLQGWTWWRGWSWVDVRRSGLLLLDALLVVLFVMHLQWSRAMDILWPVTLLALALALRFAWAQATSWPRQRTACLAAGALLVLGVSVMNVWGVGAVLDDLVPKQSLGRYVQPLSVLPGGARVLNTNWESFAPLVAIRPDLQFVQGIDPSFAYLADPMVYKLFSVFGLRGYPGLAIDPVAWLEAARRRFPDEDFLVLERSTFVDVLPSLEQGWRLPDLTPGMALATYDLRGLPPLPPVTLGVGEG